LTRIYCRKVNYSIWWTVNAVSAELGRLTTVDPNGVKVMAVLVAGVALLDIAVKYVIVVSTIQTVLKCICKHIDQNQLHVPFAANRGFDLVRMLCNMLKSDIVPDALAVTMHENKSISSLLASVRCDPTLPMSSVFRMVVPIAKVLFPTFRTHVPIAIDAFGS
jgi:hypothetical protein